MEFNVGDKVKYIPDSCHALNKNVAGHYPWVIGRIKQVRQANGSLVDTVEELSGRDLEQFLESVRRHPDPAKAKFKISLIRPAMLWDAVITGVGTDGTYSLDIQSSIGGITLHYDGIKFDPTQKVPHSFCV